MSTGPVRSVLLWLVTRFAPPEERDFIAGDLREWYLTRKAVDGAVVAWWLFLIEALRVPFRFFPGMNPTTSARSDVGLFGGVRRIAAGVSRDLLFYSRRFRKSPATMAGSTLIIALGIGGAVVVLAVFRSLLWPSTGIPNPDQVVVLERVFPAGAFANMPPREAGMIQDALDGQLTEYAVRSVTVRRGDVSRRLLSNTVSDDFFRVMAVPPVAGRDFAGRQPGTREVVLSQAMRVAVFGEADPLGAVIHVDREPATVVGIAPADFSGPAGNRPPALWVSSDDVVREQDTFGAYVQLMARRDVSGLPVPDVLLDILERERPETAGRFTLAWTPLDESVGSGGGERTFVMQGLLITAVFAGLVLFVASANVASALVADGLRRRSEFALRAAMGASRSRLVRQSLTETSALAVSAAGLGALAAVWALSLLPQWLPTSPDGSIMAFHVRGIDIATAAVLALVVALLSGIWPALLAARPVDQRVIGTAPRGMLRRGESLIVGQVAISAAVTVLAALLVGKVTRLHNADLGYDERDRWAFAFRFQGEDDQDGRRLVLDRLIANLATAPGVRAAGVMAAPPFVAFNPYTPVSLGSVSDTALVASVLAVDGGYFDVMNASIHQGRAFRSAGDTQREVVVSEYAEGQLWPGGSGLGELVYLSNSSEPFTVVGIVEDGTYGSRNVVPMIFTDLRITVPSYVQVLMHAVDPPHGATANVVASMDPDLALPSVYPVAEWFERAWVLERAIGDLSRVFSLIALAICSFGLFAFFSQWVADRRREIGIRRALGASGRSVTVSLWRRSMSIAAAGFVLGSVLALAGTRLMSTYMGGVESHVNSYLTVLIVIAGIASLSTLIPMRHANAVDPLVAIRGD